jgi:murein DD-endopeptidase MepM/ murein hydrolase activator NlpD
MTTRGVSLAVCATLIIGGLVAAAQADNALGRALHERKVTVKRLDTIHDFRRIARKNLHHRIRVIQSKIVRTRSKGPALASDRQRWSKNQHNLGSIRHGLRVRLHKLERFLAHRTLVLRTLRLSLSTWIQTYGVFRACPVNGAHDVANNFGVWVTIPGVPKHIHQGNDIMASEGTPIVAPFDGNAVASQNTLGGNTVTVYGDLGYAYNAHLSAYGTLGNVKAGELIGYVGSTGDAGGPHDHFEWHPGNGNAVDPNPYLMAVC